LLRLSNIAHHFIVFSSLWGRKRDRKNTANVSYL
jgi:hypothetical protein